MTCILDLTCLQEKYRLFPQDWRGLMQMISVIFSEERYSYKVSLVLLQGKVQKKNGASVKAFKRSNDPKFQLLILISYRTRSFILNSKTFFTE